MSRPARSSRSGCQVRLHQRFYTETRRKRFRPALQRLAVLIWFPSQAAIARLREICRTMVWRQIVEPSIGRGVISHRYIVDETTNSLGSPVLSPYLPSDQQDTATIIELDETLLLSQSPTRLRLTLSLECIAFPQFALTRPLLSVI